MSYRDEVIAYGSHYIRLDRVAEIAARADAEIAALRLDAERWRWIRRQNNREEGARLLTDKMNADAAIDVARARPMTKRARQMIKTAAQALGFTLLRLRAYLRRVPGAPTNHQWYEVRLGCPCGRNKTLHIRHESLPYLDEELHAHLQRDGLIP